MDHFYNDGATEELPRYWRGSPSDDDGLDPTIVRSLD